MIGRPLARNMVLCDFLEYKICEQLRVMLVLSCCNSPQISRYMLPRTTTSSGMNMRDELALVQPTDISGCAVKDSEHMSNWTMRGGKRLNTTVGVCVVYHSP